MFEGYLLLSGPTIIFSAVLLFLAYTNKYLAIAQLIRDRHAKWKVSKDAGLKSQIYTLRQRVGLIMYIQILSLASLIIVIGSILSMFAGKAYLSALTFLLSLSLLIASMGIYIYEILLAADALDIELDSWSNE